MLVALFVLIRIKLGTMHFKNWIQLLGILTLLSLGGCSSPTLPPQCVILSLNAGDEESLPFQKALSEMPETGNIWSRSYLGQTDICLCGMEGIGRDSIKNRSLMAFSKVGKSLPANTLINLDPRKNPFLRKLFDLDLRQIRDKVTVEDLMALGYLLASIPGLKVNGIPENHRTFTVIPNVVALQQHGITLGDLWVELRLAAKQKPLVDPEDLGTWPIVSQVDSGQFVPLSSLATLKMEATAIPEFFNIYLEDTLSLERVEEVKKKVEDDLVKFLVLHNLTEKPGMMALRAWDDRRPVRYEFSGSDPAALCRFLQDMYQDLLKECEDADILEIFPCGETHFNVHFDNQKLAAYGISIDQVTERMVHLRKKTLLAGSMSEPILNWNPLDPSIGNENVLNLAVGSTKSEAQVCIKDLAVVNTMVEIRRENMQISYPIYVWGPLGTPILNMIETYPLPEGITRKAGDSQYQFPDFRNPEDFR